MAQTKLQRARKAEFARYKEDVKREGVPFFPNAMVADTIMSLVVVAVIIGLTVLWYTTAGDTPEGKGLDAGVLGPWYTAQADPGTYQFVPRPDWFFYFLFYLLRIFKWPETVFLGTVGVPTILLILLVALPFYDRSVERRPSRRPVAMVAAVLVVISMGVLTWKGAVAEEALGSELIAEDVPAEWAELQGFAGNEAAEAGADLFAQSGCLNCHTYAGTGSSNLGAPDLTEAGKSGRGIDFFKSYVSNPAQYGNNVMISYSYLGDENLTNLATFLDASKGGASEK
jgi:ubiquinol-cytochrome c reductase cytochrome b subunit/menaquinol-cytochrome c reductase cytochrome b/c subunit